MRFVDADELRGWAASLEGVAVVSVKDEKIGGLDGLLVDNHDRPYYVANHYYNRMRSALRPG